MIMYNPELESLVEHMSPEAYTRALEAFFNFDPTNPAADSDLNSAIRLELLWAYAYWKETHANSLSFLADVHYLLGYPLLRADLTALLFSDGPASCEKLHAVFDCLFSAACIRHKLVKVAHQRQGIRQRRKQARNLGLQPARQRDNRNAEKPRL